LRQRAQRLGLHGLVSRWSEIAADPQVVRLIEIEEEERKRRGLDRRIRSSKVGRFKTMADFDWAWPSEIDREQIEEL
jgi:hypothetical protein